MLAVLIHTRCLLLDALVSSSSIWKCQPLPHVPLHFFFANVNNKVFKWCVSQIAPAPLLLVTHLLISFTQIKWLISSYISTTIRINLLLVCLHCASWWIEHPSPFVITVWFIAHVCVSIWVCASVCMMSVYMWLYDIYIGSPDELSIPDFSVFILYIVIIWEYTYKCGCMSVHICDCVCVCTLDNNFWKSILFYCVLMHAKFGYLVCTAST